MIRCKTCPNPDYICSCILHPGYREPGLEQIAAYVAKKHNMTVDDLKKKTKDQKTVRVRNKAIRMCRFNTSATLKQIAEYFNFTAHSAVIHALGGKYGKMD